MRPDSDRFRKVMGHFATGVTVVTTFYEGAPRGITVNALSSVSLDPPLVMVALDRRRFISPMVHATRRYAVNVVAEHQQALSDCFAGAAVTPDRDAFCGASWTPGEALGLPLLEGAIATLECAVVQTIPVGDHDLFIGEVIEVTNPEHHPLPLLYYRRHYLRIEQAQSSELGGKPEAPAG